MTSVAALGLAHLALGCSDGQLRVWDMRSWQVTMTLPGHSKEVARLTAVPSLDTTATG